MSYKNRLYTRRTEFNIFQHGEMLFQQYIPHQFRKVKLEMLSIPRHKLQKLRVTNYLSVRVQPIGAKIIGNEAEDYVQYNYL